MWIVIFLFLGNNNIMGMKNKSIRIAAFVLVGILSLCVMSGCNKVFINHPEGAIKFKASTSYKNGFATKTVYSGDGTYIGETLSVERIDWVEGDRIRIYSDKAITQDGDENYADYDVTPTSNSGANSYATITPTGGNGLYWGGEEDSNAFYSIYPSPSSGAFSTTITGNVITATIPEIQHYTVDGNCLRPDMNFAYMYAAVMSEPSSSVTLSFKPMFTAFEFTIDSLDDDILELASFEMFSESCALSGVISATLTAAATSESSTVQYAFSDTEENVRIDFENNLTITKGNPITFTVFALPMDLTNITVRFVSADGQYKTLRLKQNDEFVTFSACKKYRITSLGIPGEWTYSVEDIPNIIISDNMEKVYGAERIISVDSYRQRSSNSEPVTWTAFTSVDGGRTWISVDDQDWPSWLSLSSYQGTGDNNAVTVSISANDLIKGRIYGIGEPMMLEMAQSTEKGTMEQPFDLSMHTILGSTNSNGASTANSYVISSPGWYMIPLVYGNAITNGSVNTRAYAPGATANGMSAFFNADGNGISSPYILNDASLAKSGVYDGCVVWQDVMPGYDIIEDTSISIIDPPSNAGLNCKYLRFYLSPENIRPGNIVLAVRDVELDKKILWSWHIWAITESVLTNSDVKYRQNGSSLAEQSMLDVNLGWAPPLNYDPLTTRNRSVRIRIVQDDDAGTYTQFTVTQQAYTGTTYIGKCYTNTLYQWGRKDPFLGSIGDANTNKCIATPEIYPVTSGSGSTDSQSVNIANANERYSLMIRQPYRGYRASSIGDALNAWDSDNTAYSTDSKVLKTVYDPCPPGYAVPRYYSFTGFTSNGRSQTNVNNIYGDWQDADLQLGLPAGWNFTTSATNANKTVFFPSSGFRLYAGSISQVNQRGYYWTAAPYETSGDSASEGAMFMSNRVDPEYNIPYSHACSIRPVLE